MPSSSRGGVDLGVVTKISWRGKYQRLIRLTHSALLTLDPSDRRETNRFALDDVLSAEQHGSELLLEVLACGSCGLFRKQMRLALDSVDRATSLCSAVRAKLTRSVSVNDSAAARELSAESAVLSAMPRELAGSNGDGALAHSLAASSMAHQESDAVIFDVVVAVLKARGLPKPPPLCGGAVIECHWGGASTAEEHGGGGGGPSPRKRAPSIARLRASSEGTALIANAAAPAGSSASDGASNAGGGAAACTAACASTDASLATAGVAGDGPPAEDLAQLGAPVTFATAEGEGETSNPRWNYEACFRYRATDAELRARRLELRLVHRRWPLGTALIFGRVTVTLAEIASGPHKFDLPVITPTGSHAGRIVFQVSRRGHHRGTEGARRHGARCDPPHLAATARRVGIWPWTPTRGLWHAAPRAAPRAHARARPRTRARPLTHAHHSAAPEHAHHSAAPEHARARPQYARSTPAHHSAAPARGRCGR